MSRHHFSLVDLLGKYCAVNNIGIIGQKFAYFVRTKLLRLILSHRLFDSKYCIVIVNEKNFTYGWMTSLTYFHRSIMIR